MTMKFSVCINNKGYEASLEKGKIYQVKDDNKSSGKGLIRIIDESGDAYLYSKEMFVPIKVPKKVEEVLLTVK